MSKPSRDPLWLFVSIAVVVLVGVAYAMSDFIYRWHKRGDAFAQAEGSLLVFIAAAISVLVTLAFIYLTRRAVEAAQQANDEQRKEWEQRVNVTPKFWIPVTQPDLADSKPLQYMSNLRYPRISCVIWNYSEQSVLIHWIQITDINSTREQNCIFKPMEQVIQPHQTIETDIEWELFRFLCNPDAAILSMLHLGKASKILKINIHYSDWRQQQTKSDGIFYKFYGDGDEEEDGPKLYGNMISVNKKQVKCDEPEN